MPLTGQAFTSRYFVNEARVTWRLTAYGNPARWWVPGPDTCVICPVCAAKGGTMNIRTGMLAALAATIGLWSVGAWAQAGPPQVTVAKPLASRVAQWDEFTGR